MISLLLFCKMDRYGGMRLDQMIAETLDDGKEMWKPPGNDETTTLWNFSSLTRQEISVLKRKITQTVVHRIDQFNAGKNPKQMGLNRTQDLLYGVEIFLNSTANETQCNQFFVSLIDDLSNVLGDDVSSIQRTRDIGNSIVVEFLRPIKLECLRFLVRSGVLAIILVILIQFFLFLTSLITTSLTSPF